ncbi:GNAT family N-acetyltransferase [Parabacteroides pacaensis]|uniref:GNAT family N-acetyltransferase n=1 Tax=Parabacteroides pacaensis TaxID=2086575 RepID=UPI000D110449|nr:GNAT family N-acetyltransferase [Parabacteroides pacaensis]
MLSLQQATIENCSVINKLASQIWEPTYGSILSKEQLDYMFEMMYAPDNIRKQMEEQGHTYLILYADDVPSGYISIEQVEKDLFILQKIYLLPSKQGKGWGRFMVEQGFRYIKNLHPEPCKVMLYVNRENKALGFYKALGLQIKDTRDYPIGHGFYMNDYIMEKDL